MTKTMCKKDREIKHKKIKYSCARCKREAEKKKHLCKPQKI